MRRILVATLAGVCACGRGPQPELASAPVVASSPGSVAIVTVAQSGAATSEADAMSAGGDDLGRRTAELFGDALRVNASIAMPSDSGVIVPNEAEPTWDIEVHSYETFDRVRFYVASFTGTARDRFADRLSRGTRYEAMIRAKLRAGGLPEDMYYLALVESGFNPHAYSRAAAVGMWQFMATTARGLERSRSHQPRFRILRA